MEEFQGLEMTSLKETVSAESSRKSMVLFVLGGLSFSEVLTLQKIAKIKGINLLILTTNVLNKRYFKNFIHSIN